MADDPKLPSIKGRIAQRIRDAQRARDAQPLEWEPTPAPLTLQRPGERAAMLSAALLLDTIRQGHGTRHDADSIREAIIQLRRGFQERELMQIEIEVYEILRWLGHTIDPTWPTKDPHIERVSPESSHVEVILWALEQGQDLIMDYYHPGRGEVTRRQVTPIKLEAETYLQGFCHLRADERIFRLSRIGELKPAAGWPVRKHGLEQPPPGPEHGHRPRRHTPEGQMSLTTLADFNEEEE